MAGAAVLIVISLVRRQRPPRELVVWAHLGTVALLLRVVPFLLFAWAEQHVSSGLASIYNATTPLMATLFALVALSMAPAGPARRDPSRAHLPRASVAQPFPISLLI